MDIIGAEGKHVKIGKSSITVRGDNGKTCGIVRNIEKLCDMRGARQFEYLRKIRGVDFFGTYINNDSMFARVIICDGKVYYFNDLRPIERYNKLAETVKPEDLARYYAADMEHNQTRLELVEKSKANNINVINCYID